MDGLFLGWFDLSSVLVSWIFKEKVRFYLFHVLVSLLSLFKKKLQNKNNTNASRGGSSARVARYRWRWIARPLQSSTFGLKLFTPTWAIIVTKNKRHASWNSVYKICDRSLPFQDTTKKNRGKNPPHEGQILLPLPATAMDIRFSPKGDQTEPRRIYP